MLTIGKVRMLHNALLLIHVWLGNWWAFGGLFLLTGFVFGYLVPRAKAPIFAAVTTDLPKRVLDEYMMTWRAHDAERVFLEIGPEGREAYRVFYRRTDFWFPGLVISLLYVSFLALAFPPSSAIITGCRAVIRSSRALPLSSGRCSRW